eukprot:579134-Rhodomonas_salina.4
MEADRTQSDPPSEPGTSIRSVSTRRAVVCCQYRPRRSAIPRNAPCKYQASPTSSRGIDDVTTVGNALFQLYRVSLSRGMAYASTGHGVGGA